VRRPYRTTRVLRAAGMYTTCDIGQSVHFPLQPSLVLASRLLYPPHKLRASALEFAHTYFISPCSAVLGALVALGVSAGRAPRPCVGRGCRDGPRRS
jgi:hypothetical protein